MLINHSDIFDDPLSIVQKPGKELNHLPNILSDVAIYAFFRFIKSMFTSEQISLERL